MVVFAIHWHESATGVHVSPIPNPLPPPSHPIPLGCPSAPALSALFHALNLDWSSISRMVIYMFQCYSLKSSHPCLLPQSLKICSLYLCLFWCLIYKVIVIIFLNSVYLCKYTVLLFLFLTYFTPYVCVCCLVMSNSLQPMDCSLPGSSIHGILQARILEWVAISFSRGSSQPRNKTQVFCIAGRCFTLWATGKATIPSKLGIRWYQRVHVVGH